MARPIKETPLLQGNDAKRFVERKEKNDKKKASKSEMDKMNKGYSLIKKMAKF